MLDNLKGSLRLLSSIVVLGFQLVIPQASIEHRKVPQRIEEQNAAIEEDSTGIPGMWGSWGPWSACSRSCSGGVMEQTRPCLPGYYYERSYHRPGQFSASERMLPHQQSRHQQDPLNPYSGHVISAIRTSVPLHRNEEQSRAGLRVGVYSGGRNDSHLGRGTPRGGRQSRRRSPKTERRGRNKNPIGPGKYGYGKVPYILPLQADTGQSLQKPRRQRQSTQNTANQQNVGNPFGHPVTPPQYHGRLYQEDQRTQSRPQVGSFYQQTGPHLPSFPASQSLFHSPELNAHVPGSQQSVQSQAPSQRTSAIVCIGAYKQYKLCNRNACPENRSVREVQCASYNNKPFMGRFYEWEPFVEGETVGFSEPTSDFVRGHLLHCD